MNHSNTPMIHSATLLSCLVGRLRRAAPVASLFLVGALASVAGATTNAEFATFAWDKTNRGTVLNMSGLSQTFTDNFATLDVSADTVTAPSGGPWYSPVHSDYGGGTFKPPGGADSPFALVSGGLRIRAEKIGTNWQSGTMQTVDKTGHGFAQQYGYFEMTASFPAGQGPWPAFWLLSQNGFLDKTKTRTEIDAVEWYGSDPRGHHAAVHLWPSNPLEPGSVTTPIYNSSYYNMSSLPAFSNNQWTGLHSYGVSVSEDWVIVYLDRKELERFPTLPEFKTPLYIVAGLAINTPEVSVAVSPLDMTITNISAYQFTPIPEPTGLALGGIALIGLLRRRRPEELGARNPGLPAYGVAAGHAGPTSAVVRRQPLF